MSFEFIISLRYLRSKRKQMFVSVITLISVAGIMLGVAALIIVLAVMNGFETDLRNKILGINSHITLMEYGSSLRDYKGATQKVEKVEGVVAATPFIYSQAILKNGEGASGVILRGLDYETAFNVINLGRMRDGSIAFLAKENRRSLKLDTESANMPGIVIGRELAKNMGIFIFDTVHIISTQGISTPGGMTPRIKKFLVVGIFDSGFYEYDSTLAFLSLKDCQKLLDMGTSVTGLEIKVDEIYRAGKIARTIERRLGFPYWARHWMEMNKNLFSALRLEKRVMFVILSLIVLVAIFNVITTLIMVVMEKSRDIAILKSMGATSVSIMKIFIYQGLTIGIIGTTLGCFLGLGIALHLEKISLLIESFFGFKILPGDVYYLSSLPSLVDYGDVLTIVLGTLAVSFLATIYPSRRASRLDPAEALRYD